MFLMLVLFLYLKEDICLIIILGCISNTQWTSTLVCNVLAEKESMSP